MVRPGFEDRVPKSPDDFARLWRGSPERRALIEEMDEYEKSHPKGRSALDEFNEAAKMRKSKHIPKKSPYTVTIFMQIQACVVRAYQRMWGDKSTLGATYAANIIMSLVIGSVFYNTLENTSGFFSKVLPYILNPSADHRLGLCSLGFCSMLLPLWEKSVNNTASVRSLYTSLSALC